jgi:hypothetical protein
MSDFWGVENRMTGAPVPIGFGRDYRDRDGKPEAPGTITRCQPLVTSLVSSLLVSSLRIFLRNLPFVHNLARQTSHTIYFNSIH